MTQNRLESDPALLSEACLNLNGALTGGDVWEHGFNPEFLRYLRSFVERNPTVRCKPRILNWGCGRWLGVIRFHQLRYEVHGVDRDASRIREGRAYLKSLARAVPGWLQTLDDRGRAKFPDGYLEFVYSQYVLEQVEDMDGVAREIARLMASPGAGLHLFPASHDSLKVTY